VPDIARLVPITVNDARGEVQTQDVNLQEAMKTKVLHACVNHAVCKKTRGPTTHAKFLGNVIVLQGTVGNLNNGGRRLTGMGPGHNMCQQKGPQEMEVTVSGSQMIGNPRQMQISIRNTCNELEQQLKPETSER